MADEIKISGMTVATALGDDDIFPIVQDGVNKTISGLKVAQKVIADGKFLGSNCLFVDLAAVAGVAERGNINKPFSDLPTAITAASSGDTIFVFSCDETGFQTTLKDGVNIVFLGGDACKAFGFTDNSVQVICSISGKFICNYGIILDCATSDIKVSDLYMSTTAAIRAIVVTTGAKLKLSNSTIQTLEATSGYSLAYIGDGSTFIVDNCQFKCSSTFQRAVDLNATGIFKIKDSVIECGHTESIISSAALNIYVYGTLTSNKTKNSNITIKIGNFVVDTAVTVI
jgi:hypothetical protein